MNNNNLKDRTSFETFEIRNLRGERGADNAIFQQYIIWYVFETYEKMRIRNTKKESKYLL